MAVSCVFYTPNAKHRCQVLQLAGASPRIGRTQRQLEERYCLSGRFIACPMFTRVERGLAEVDRFRLSRTAKTPLDLQAAS